MSRRLTQIAHEKTGSVQSVQTAIRLQPCDAEEKKMPLIYIVLVLIVVGMALWLINTYIPMAGSHQEAITKRSRGGRGMRMGP